MEERAFPILTGQGQNSCDTARLRWPLLFQEGQTICFTLLIYCTEKFIPPLKRASTSTAVGRRSEYVFLFWGSIRSQVHLLDVIRDQKMPAHCTWQLYIPGVGKWNNGLLVPTSENLLLKVYGLIILVITKIWWLITLESRKKGRFCLSCGFQWTCIYLAARSSVDSLFPFLSSTGVSSCNRKSPDKLSEISEYEDVR